MADQFSELGHSGVVDLFTLARCLGHRLGLACWGPPGILGGCFDELVATLDSLDGSAAFVTPAEIVRSTDDGREHERRALAEWGAVAGRFDTGLPQEAQRRVRPTRQSRSGGRRNRSKSAMLASLAT